MSYPSRVNKMANHPFDLAYSDVLSSCLIKFKLDFWYFITFVDDSLCVTWFYLMKSCSEIFYLFQILCLRLKLNLTLL